VASGKVTNYLLDMRDPWIACVVVYTDVNRTKCVHAVKGIELSLMEHNVNKHRTIDKVRSTRRTPLAGKQQSE
jgi:hypothetical protein